VNTIWRFGDFLGKKLLSLRLTSFEVNSIKKKLKVKRHSVKPKKILVHYSQELLQFTPPHFELVTPPFCPNAAFAFVSGKENKTAFSSTDKDIE
jgi:hypothetical protein